MTSYIDSSVLLRIILRAPQRLREWSRIEHFLASTLVRVECFRALHRLRFTQSLTEEEFVYRIENTERALLGFELISVADNVLVRAAGPFTSPLKTLDAIHLATASLWRDREDPAIFFATHDQQLALAARAMGFATIGV